MNEETKRIRIDLQGRTIGDQIYLDLWSFLGCCNHLELDGWWVMLSTPPGYGPEVKAKAVRYRAEDRAFLDPCRGEPINVVAEGWKFLSILFPAEKQGPCQCSDCKAQRAASQN